jgi:hypothetical protein
VLTDKLENQYRLCEMHHTRFGQSFVKSAVSDG